MAKLTLTDISAGYNLTTTTNANNALVEAALENTVSRDGTSPNTMSANFDLNSNKVTNVTDGTNDQDACTVAQLNAAAANTLTSVASVNATVDDAGGFFSSSNVEAALQELGLSVVQEGTLEVTWTGFTTSPVSTVNYVVQGSTCTIVVEDGVSATSNQTLFSSSTFLPAACRPTAAKEGIFLVTENGTDQFGRILVSPNGQISFYPSAASTSFTNSGTKGLPRDDWQFTYYID